MEVEAKLTIRGIVLSVYAGKAPGPLVPSPDANQTKPRRCYVYAHLDSSRKMFYVGKGTDRRAWSADRDNLWARYVRNYLNGEYQIRILQDNLSPDEALEAEADWIDQCPDPLVNWVNTGRQCDYEALKRCRQAELANRALIQEAKAIEKTDLERAASMYIQTIDGLRGYAGVICEGGLVGQLRTEEAAEVGIHGDPIALDRLTMCLVKLGRAAEAVEHAEKYFALYRFDLNMNAAKRIAARIEKALARTENRNNDMRSNVASPPSAPVVN